MLLLRFKKLKTYFSKFCDVTWDFFLGSGDLGRVWWKVGRGATLLSSVIRSSNGGEILYGDGVRLIGGDTKNTWWRWKHEIVGEINRQLQHQYFLRPIHGVESNYLGRKNFFKYFFEVRTTRIVKSDEKVVWTLEWGRLRPLPWSEIVQVQVQLSEDAPGGKGRPWNVIQPNKFFIFTFYNVLSK